MINGEGVAIATLKLRHNSDVIEIEAWRAAARTLENCEADTFRLISGVKKISKRSSEGESVALRFINTTTHGECPATLLAALQAETTDTDAQVNIMTKTNGPLPEPLQQREGPLDDAVHLCGTRGQGAEGA